MRSLDQRTNTKYTVTWNLLRDVISKILLTHNSPRALQINDVIHHDPRGLLDNPLLKISPMDYRFRPREYFYDAQCIALVKKLSDIGIDDLEQYRLERTRNDFLDRELDNYYWNQQLPIVENENPFIRSVFKHARFLIRTILGDCPDLPELPDLPIGKGVTSTLRGARCNIYEKLHEKTVISSSCLTLLAPFMASNPFYQAFYGEEYEIEDYCDIAFVSKAFDALRLVTFDPSVNKQVQRHYGVEIQQRMDATIYKGKWPLSKRPDLHQKLVIDASKGRNSLSTLDVKNASNSIYDTLCFRLLPNDWYRILNKARIKKGYFEDGKLHHFQMFSSNGNGFTFELETLIFYALCHGVKATMAEDGFISVFGDDIIISDHLYNGVTYVLENIGIQVNDQKSFTISSFFRESCGEDRFYGRDVRPVFFKDFGEGIMSLFKFHNRLVQVCDNFNFSEEATSEIIDMVISRIPKSLRFFGPKSLGDGVLHSEQFTYTKYKWSDSEGRVWVCPYTRAVKQLVEFRGSVSIDPFNDYKTMWKIMYYNNAKDQRFICDSFAFIPGRARESTILVESREISRGLMTRGPIKRVKIVHTAMP